MPRAGGTEEITRFSDTFSKTCKTDKQNCHADCSFSDFSFFLQEMKNQAQIWETKTPQ